MASDQPLLWIDGDGLRAGITPFGASLWDLRVAGTERPLVIGFADEATCRASRTYAGSVVGRVCNRLAGGRARLGDRLLSLDRNVPPYHLHGGTTGFSLQTWRVDRHEPDRIVLSLISPDGHEGYPGRLSVTAEYVAAGTTLALVLTATTDAPTLVNLTHHTYFDLTGRGSASHRLRLAADHRLEADADLVPTGRVRPVAGTSLDFRVARAFAVDEPDVINHTMVATRTPRTEPAFAAEVTGDGGPAMELWTTQTALHVYDGYKIPPATPLREGRTVGPRGAFCLEAQGWTDAPNHPDFPSIELQPHQVYHQVTEYRFRR
jgi:aldose 1-epimerase